MEKIILIAHGSRREDAINLNLLAECLHRMIHPICNEKCVKGAYLQFNEPDLISTISECANEGADSIILHPFFLSSGMHVINDIPEIIERAKNSFPHIKFIYTEPLGTHEFVLRAVYARIKEARASTGEEIERQSMELIEQELDLSGIIEEQVPVVKRVIHATADVEIGRSLLFHPDAIRAGLDAIRGGKGILTDVRMVKVGINHRKVKGFGGEVLCAMDFLEDTGSPKEGTKAELAIEKALESNYQIGILAIGNAPTALLKAMELIDSGVFRPDLLVGVPVGFVKAFESKLLLSQKPYPFITNLSRKGGSPVAVAIVNALLKMAEGE